MTFKQWCGLVAVCVLLYFLTACVHPIAQNLVVAPADSTRSAGGEFTNLAIAALIVLVLIPVLVRPK